MSAVKSDVIRSADDHVLGRYGFESSKKSIARKPALKDAEWGAPAGTKYSSPRRHVRVALSIVRRISPSTTIPHCAPWLCSGTDESSRAWNKVAEPVRPWSSHSVTPCNEVSRVQSLHEEAPCDEQPGPKRDQLGFPNPARVVDGELPQARADLTGRCKDVRLEVEALRRESETLETVLAERPHPRAHVADRESEQECGEAAQRLVTEAIQRRERAVFDAAAQPRPGDDIAPGIEGLDELRDRFGRVRPIRIEHDVHPRCGDVLATPIVHEVIERLADPVPFSGALLDVDAGPAFLRDLRGRIHGLPIHDPHVHVVPGTPERFHRDPFDHGAHGVRLVEGREQDHDTSGPDIARSQVPTRLAIVDERSGTPEDPASVRRRTKGRSRPGHRERFEERPTEPWTARRRPGPTFLDALGNPERHLRSPNPVGRRGSRGVRFGP